MKTTSFRRFTVSICDIADAGLTLELRCRQCRRLVVVSPSVLLRRFPPKARFVDLVLRLRCGDDGMLPDGWLVLEDERVGHEAMRRGLELHRPRRG